MLPYPPKTETTSTEQHTQACQITRHARNHLKYLCEKTLQKTSLSPLEPATEHIAMENLTSVIESRNERPLEQFLIAFINRTEDPDIIEAMAKLLSLLVGDAALTSVVPFRYHQHVLQTCPYLTIIDVNPIIIPFYVSNIITIYLPPSSMACHSTQRIVYNSTILKDKG